MFALVVDICTCSDDNIVFCFTESRVLGSFWNSKEGLLELLPYYRFLWSLLDVFFAFQSALFTFHLWISQLRNIIITWECPVLIFPRLFRFRYLQIRHFHSTFSEMFVIAFGKLLPTFRYFESILSCFHKMSQLFWFEKQLAASQFFRTLAAHRSAAAK